VTDADMTDREPECYDLPNPVTGFPGCYGWARFSGVTHAKCGADWHDVIPDEVFDALTGGELDECGWIRLYDGREAAIEDLKAVTR
jgi:hypothetical protein